MTGLDKIFEKSNLDEDKKKSKRYLGRLLLRLKKDDCIKLYSLLGNVIDTDIKDGKFMIKLSDKVSFEMINANDRELIGNIVNEFEDGLKIDISYDEKFVFDSHAFKNYLKDEFGKILTIK
ncbi:MAG: hypothetical protein E7345_05420 [Clostridiales bacterium]|nr:hypothetical protein [Clostridiales bacterium]